MGETSDGKEERPQVRLFTDGACIDNPGPGGWAYILRHVISGRSKEDSGGEHGSTNNRMEIMAVIRGLETLKKQSRMELFSDSQYVITAITDWMPRWKRNGWRKSPKSRDHVRNVDLWRRLDELLQIHDVKAEWVRGHDGHPENERCDQLAEAAAARIAALPPPAKIPEPSGTDEDSLFRKPTNQDSGV
jgi:ribonuclease HI